MITKEQLDAWRKLAEEASEGPWRAVLLYDFVSDATYIEGCDFASAQSGIGEEELDTVRIQIHKDAKFIAMTRETIPLLIEEVERLRGSHCDNCDVIWGFGEHKNTCPGVK